ncbi:MAG: divalent-cation tolerance protein CutA [Opitutus sp.]
MMTFDSMHIAWTTVANREEADALASHIVAKGLAVCVQVDGPITSHFVWEGKAERSEEFRLTLKFLGHQLSALEGYVLSHHPYSVPEWVVAEAVHVGEKYLSWANANPSNLPFSNSQPSL